MPDQEIKCIKIEIIQFLRETDDPQGVKLYEEIKKIESEDSIYEVRLHEVHDKNSFFSALDDIYNTITEPSIVTVHIDSHGCEDGVGIDHSANFVSWQELYAHIRPINIKVHNTLMLIMSVCEGGGMMTRLEPWNRAPFMAFIANTRPVSFNDAAIGFPLFYKYYRSPLDFSRALDALNNSIDFTVTLPDGRKKTEFFVYSSRELFEQVMNPDRDPDNFKNIALSQTYSDSSITDEEKIILARRIVIQKADQLRPYFNFQDIYPQ